MVPYFVYIIPHNLLKVSRNEREQFPETIELIR